MGCISFRNTNTFINNKKKRNVDDIPAVSIT